LHKNRGIRERTFMSITRVHYRERQRLTVADLRAEQDYRLGLAGRHHLTHHEWGIVRGLRIVEEENGFTLTPGVAIDGYGREILVSAPVALEVDDPEGCSFVLLYYCDDPEQVPPGRVCEDDPAPRVRQRSALVAAETFAPPLEMPDDFTRARAAGQLNGLPPWPVLVAKVGRGCGSADRDTSSNVDYSETRYVRHRAGIVRSPTGRALMQLGPSSSSDVYHFLLSTKPNGSGLTKRIGIDRDGVVHVWRPLVIAGTQAVGKVALGENKVLFITTAMPAGIGRRIHVTGVVDPGSNTLSASFLDLGDRLASQRPALQGSIRLAKKGPLSVNLPFGETRSASFNLLDATRLMPVAMIEVPRRPRRQEQPPDGPQQPQPEEPPPRLLAKSISVELKPTGGKLTLRSVKPPSEVPPPTGCEIDRFRAEAGESGTPVVQFRPADEIKADPLAREIHAVVTSKPSDPVPQTELRLSGGNEDDSDASSRLTIGAWVDKTWTPALRMDGGRRLEILAGPGRASKLDQLLRVEDTVYLPPIGKKDPLLPDLMAMAFISGLRKIGRVAAGVTLDLQPPAKLIRGGPLTYKLSVNWTGAIQLKRCLEIITGTASTGDMAFRTLTLVDSSSKLVDFTSATSPQTFTIGPDQFTHPATKVRIEIQMLVSKGNVTSVAVGTSPEIDVVNP
jgi:hypothetical protein